jgi:hypothetical protein
MKQIKKLSLTDGIGKMTRNEMRNVMAGGVVAPCGESNCKTSADCPDHYGVCKDYECNSLIIKVCGYQY